jgi:putative membrane protein
LHRWSILFLLGDSLKSLLLPLAALFFASRQSWWDTWLLLFSFPVGLFSVWRYFTTFYELAEDELVVRTGLLFRNERHIRYARVQNIESLQNPFHRLLRVAEVRVETAGASEQEAKLRVLSATDAEEVRRRVVEGKRRALAAAPTAAAEAATGPAEAVAAGVETQDIAPAGETALRPLVRLGLGDLVAFGLTQNRGGLVIGAILGLLWEADLFDFDLGRPTRIARAFVKSLIADGRLFRDPGLREAALVAAGLAVILVFVRVLSVGWAIVQLYRFTLTRQGDEMRTMRGLLTRVHGTIPLSRVQLVTVRQAPLMRLFGRVEVRVQTAGGDKDASPAREWLAPSLREQDVDALVGEVFPGVWFSSLDWRPAHARAARRMWRSSLRWMALAFLPALAFPPTRVAALATLVPAVVFAALAARRRARSLGHALLPDHVGARGGWWWRHASLARYAKVQAVSLGTNPIDRRWDMAGVSADTAGGGSHRITMECLDTGEARAVYEHLCARAAATTFRW